MKRYQRIGWILALVLAIIIGSAVPAAAREPRNQERQYRPAHQTQERHARAHNTRARHTPRRHVPVVVKDRTYFYLNGIFYRRGLYGHIAVQAPLGAVVVSLPIGSHSVVVAGTTYYVFGGVYYSHVPSGYMVVKKPYMGDAYCSTDNGNKTSEKVMVIPRILNVRQGPGKRHPVVYKVYRDDILKIIGRAPGWVYVHLPCGNFGWVMTEYVAPVRPSAKG